MRFLIVGGLTALALALAPAAGAGVIESVDSTADTRGTTYHVTPTDAGRSMGSSGRSHDPRPEMTEHGVPTTQTLVRQLVCHIVFAGGKPVWNLEDWRPVVSDQQMINTTCNP